MQNSGKTGIGPLRVMVVDDDPFVRDVAVTALGAGGVEVMACDSGAAALAAFEGFAPALLLLDLMMPEMDGRAVWKAVSARANRPRLIFLTACDDDATRAEVMALGAEGLIAKPFDPGAFAASVLGFADKARTRTARLEALARDFTAGLPAARDALERTWAGLGTWDDTAAEALLAAVHRLAGVAPMFGFKVVGAAADRVEDLLRAALANGGWRGDAERRAAEEGVRALIAAVDACPGGLQDRT